MDKFMEQEVSINRVPMDAFWDQNDPRLFGIETEYVKDLSKEADAEESQIMGRDYEMDDANTGFSKKGKEDF